MVRLCTMNDAPRAILPSAGPVDTVVTAASQAQTPMQTRSVQIPTPRVT
jgi:hypothetical protein